MSGSWHALLVRIGERCPDYGGHTEAEDHIESCLTSLLRDLHQYGNEILALLMQCAEELPHKDPLYGTLVEVGLINLENAEFAGKVLDQVHDGLQAALDSGNCNKMRVLLRFLTVLMCSNIVAPGSLIEVFETLVSAAATTIDEDGGNPAWQPRADFYVFCILASLPWGGLELAERAPEDLERVLAGVEAYLSLRKRCAEPSCFVSDILEKDDGSESTTDQEDYLEDLWSRIQTLMENGWRIDSVPRPHLAFEARLVTGQSHDFGTLNCPEAPKLQSNPTDIVLGIERQEAEEMYPRRVGRLRIFPPSKTDETIAPIDRFVVEEYLLDVLFYLNGCRKECAAYMVYLPVPFRYEYLMAETVFSQLLLLPKPPFKLIYYTVVMVDLCKALPGAFPAVVAGAVRILFGKVGDMDVECCSRLVQWLSHHLANFQFVWPWEEWSHVLSQPKWSPQRVFAQEVLEKEVRLAYWDKIKESLHSSPNLVELLPPKNLPYFEYSADHNKTGAPEAEGALANELIGLVRGKKSAKDIQGYIDERILPTHGRKIAIAVVVQTLLYINSKSFTHTLTALEKYGILLSKLATSDQGCQVLMLDAVSQLWRNSVQMTAIVIDRMMGYRIVSNLSIATWVFSLENVKKFHTSDHIWEILRNALNKTNNRISDLKKDVTSLERTAHAAIAAAAKAHEKLETAHAFMAAAEQEEARIQATAKIDWAKSVVKKTKDEEISVQENFEAKETMLAQALRDQETLFVAVFRSFTNVLTEHLSVTLPGIDASINPSGDTVASVTADPMVIDGDNPTLEEDEKNSTGDGEQRNQRYNHGKSNGALSVELQVQEELQWRKSTLGHLRAVARHYAAEVWPLMGKLYTEVFNDDCHPLVLKAVHSGLTRSS